MFHLVQVVGDDIHPGRKAILVRPDGSEVSFPVIKHPRLEMQMAMVSDELLKEFIEAFSEDLPQ